MSVEQGYRPGQDYLKAPTIELPNNRGDITHDVDETITVKKSVTPSIRATTTIISIASPMLLQAPSIAVTSSSNDILAGDDDKGTEISSTPKRPRIDFVRFDSVETIYKQLDHSDGVHRAKIKDEIHRYAVCKYANILTLYVHICFSFELVDYYYLIFIGLGDGSARALYVCIEHQQ